MSGGAYSALSGMKTRLEELDRLAADLANIGTSGYKTERAAKAVAEREAFDSALNSAVDVVGHGSKIDFRGGTLAGTGRDLDVAIDGRGFFVVDTEAGPRYTRDGSFTRRSDGLLTTASGEPVQGDGGEIRLPKGQVSIAEDGTIKVGDTIAGRLKRVEFASESDLVRESGARFRAIPGATPNESSTAVIGGSLEQSNVSAVDRMAALTEITRAFEGLQRGVSLIYNDIDARAISELGRR